MICINKAQAIYIRQNYKDIPITRTMKQKSKRHKYYAPEMPEVTEAIKKINS